MKFSPKKLTALLLAGLMLLPMTACGNDPDEAVQTDAATTEAAIDEETRDPNYTCDLPANLDYGNTTIGFLYPGDSQRGQELKSEGLTGNIVGDAVYERNLAVENQLKVKFDFIDRGSDFDVVSTINNYVQAGDRSAELFSLASYVCMGPILSGAYLNLREVGNIDLDKFYWTQGYNELMTLGNNVQFVANSPVAISTFRVGYLTLFNRDLLRDRGMPDIYEAVENGTWTLDYQYNLIKDIYVDADGDGQASDGDMYGFSTGTVILLDGYFTATGVQLIRRNEDGEREFNEDCADRMVDAVEKVSRLLNAPGSHLNLGGGTTMGKFTSETAIMINAMFSDLESNISELADISYGIAPLPKLTESQKKYGTYIQDQVSSFGISAAVGEEDRQDTLGAVMEAMAYHSNELVRPAYYDSVLSLRFMQDPASKSILDTMFESISFDYCFVTGLGGVRDDLRTLLPESNPSIASKLKIWKSRIRATLRSEQGKIDKLAQR